MKSGDIQEQLRRENSVVIFPVIQAGQFHIREEEDCLRQLFYHLDPTHSRDTTPDFQPLLNLTSGYFGLSKLYKNIILRSHVPTSIICASPEVRVLSHLIRLLAHYRHLQANGFYGSKGISSRLPEAYTWLEQRFMSAVRASQTHNSRSVPGFVELKEWNRQGWTYHAKGALAAFPHVLKLTVGLVHLFLGIWLSPNPESPPILTLFGSTNLNSRSAHLDTELSFVMLANSEAVQEKLQLELQGLQNFAEDWKGDRRNVRAVTKLLTRLLNGYL